MKTRSRVKISDKLAVLMTGLVLGFFLIGLAYFFQVHDDSTVRQQKQLREQALSSLLVWQETLARMAATSVTRETQQAETVLGEFDASFLLAFSNSDENYQSLKNNAEQLNALLLDNAQNPPAGVLASEWAALINQTALSTLMAMNTVAQPLVNSVHEESNILVPKLTLSNLMFVGLLFSVAMVAAVGMYFIYKSIVFPLAHMQRIIRKINDGDTSARVMIVSQDELGDLGSAFNQLVDDRIQVLESQSRENEQLNNSIISLIRALGTIAKRDLTVKVPVSDDITGAVSDAVNLLTSETSKTLHQVRDISTEVNAISTRLQEQSKRVIKVADNERSQVMETSKALELTARTMNMIADEAESANNMAKDAMGNTRQAMGSVVETVEGIRNIRGSISETEKRIKRLGERSQEITGIVNLINSISERTHILALNASMHAASAGEAGKGFAVVADEVQRLAENAREATEEISTMVNTIRIETADTVNTMNTLITQVAEGSKLAESAGKQMALTEQSTKQLVDTVLNISKSSISQAEFSNKVRDRATIIRKSTEQTGRQLLAQTRHTNELKSFSEELVERVSMFTLPESDRREDRRSEDLRQESVKASPLESPSSANVKDSKSDSSVPKIVVNQ